MKKILLRFLLWVLKDEFHKLHLSNTNIVKRTGVIENRLDNIFKNLEVSVDVHDKRYSKSWAVISIQGEHSDFIKFIDLGKNEIHEIQQFLNHFNRSKIDACPNTSPFFKFKRDRL